MQFTVINDLESLNTPVVGVSLKDFSMEVTNWTEKVIAIYVYDFNPFAVGFVHLF